MSEFRHTFDLDYDGCCATCGGSLLALMKDGTSIHNSLGKPVEEPLRNKVDLSDRSVTVGLAELPAIQVITEDDKAELYSLFMELNKEGSKVLYVDVIDRINTIFFDKLKEVIEVMDSELQINPMNGDGGNYRINKIFNKLVRKYKLPWEDRSYRWNGR